MARKRRRPGWHAGELNLVAMIDVAFQLLNFFVITAHPIDVFTNFSVFRPQAQERQKNEEEFTGTLNIMVYKGGYALEKVKVDLKELDRQIARVAAVGKNVSVIVKCTGDSSHDSLVNVLNVCAKSGLTKVSIFSM